MQKKFFSEFYSLDHIPSLAIIHDNTYMYIFITEFFMEINILKYIVQIKIHSLYELIFLFWGE